MELEQGQREVELVELMKGLSKGICVAATPRSSSSLDGTFLSLICQHRHEGVIAAMSVLGTYA